MARRDQRLEAAEDGPGLPDLRAEFNRCLQLNQSGLFQRHRLNIDTRYCVWPFQSIDGRKWYAPAGKKPFPWEGASDARVPLVDLLINEDVARLMVVWKRNKIQVHGTESHDDEFARRLTQVLRWLKYTQMPEAYREQELLANIMLERGTAVKGVFWTQEWAKGYEELNRKDLIRLALAVSFGLAQAIGEATRDAMRELPTQLDDPAGEEAAAQTLGQLLTYRLTLADQSGPPGSMQPTPAALRQAVRDLRENGTARVAMPYRRKNRPTVLALTPNEDLFVPDDTPDLADARVIFWREAVSETALRERALSLGWDPAWIRRMLETQRGRFATDIQPPRRNGRVLTQRTSDNQGQLFEVVHAYRRLNDPAGVPGIYYTCFSPGIDMQPAYHGLLDYQHGQYPFVLYERESVSRLFAEARGYGEIASTWQTQFKAEWDMQVDRGLLTTIPPFYHPFESDVPDWGPGVRIPTNRRDEYGFGDIPRYDPTSDAVASRTLAFALRYFGRGGADGTPPGLEAQALAQHLADKWMESESQADTMILQLMQQFCDPVFYYRIVGSSKGRSIRARRDEIQGAFDVSISYSLADLDAELIAQKMALLEKAVQMDRTGRVDANAMLEVVFESVDPNLGERVLTPQAEASAAEIKDEADTLTKLLNGLSVPVQPAGQNWMMRARWLSDVVQQNPTVQRRMAEDPNVQKAVDTRMKALEFQHQQHFVNPLTGVLGPQVRDAGRPAA